MRSSLNFDYTLIVDILEASSKGRVGEGFLKICSLPYTVPAPFKYPQLNATIIMIPQASRYFKIGDVHHESQLTFGKSCAVRTNHFDAGDRLCRTPTAFSDSKKTRLLIDNRYLSTDLRSEQTHKFWVTRPPSTYHSLGSFPSDISRHEGVQLDCTFCDTILV